MPYFSISNKYREQNDDPAIQRWMNSLPLSTIRATILGTTQVFATTPPLTPVYTAVNLTTVTEDTASFFPVVSVANPVTGVTIPKDAGGLYIYSFFGAWTAAPAAGFKTVVHRFNTPPATVDVDLARTIFSELDCLLIGFLYLNPGDTLSPLAAQSSGADNTLQGVIFKFARVTV